MPSALLTRPSSEELRRPEDQHAVLISLAQHEVSTISLLHVLGHFTPFPVCSFLQRLARTGHVQTKKENDTGSSLLVAVIFSWEIVYIFLLVFLVVCRFSGFLCEICYHEDLVLYVCRLESRFAVGNVLCYNK